MTEEQPIRLQPKIHINICTHRAMNAFFVNSLIYMIEHMHRTGMRYEMNCHVGVSNLVAGRENRVSEAIASACTHMLFLDDDMVFAMDIVHKLLHEMNKLTMAGEKKIAMGVNPCRKSPSALQYTAKELDRDEFVKSRGQQGVVEVSKCGLGVFLIETAILREMEEPFFGSEWVKEKQEHMGEDFYFIKKLREHGVKIFIDQDISQNIGHAGEFIYTYGCYPPEKIESNE